MEKEQLKEILELHKKWLNGEPDGVRADLSGANLSENYLLGADLRKAYMRGTNLRETCMCKANLRKVDLSGAYMLSAYMNEVDLTNANMYGAYMYKAHLVDACLRGSNLCRAYMVETDLHGADMGGACMRDTNLREANMRGTNLRGVYLLNEANLSEAKGLDGFICVSRIGPRRNQMVWDATNDIVYYAYYQCPMAEFSVAIEKDCAGNPKALAEYRLAIEFVKKVKAARDEAEELLG
jgi:hypothetical protein